MDSNEELNDFILNELVLLDYGGNFYGIEKELSLSQLYVLKGLIEAEITLKAACK